MTPPLYISVEIDPIPPSDHRPDSILDNPAYLRQRIIGLAPGYFVAWTITPTVLRAAADAMDAGFTVEGEKHKIKIGRPA